MGTLKTNGDQKTHFGPHGDQSPQMGTNVGAVPNSLPFIKKISPQLPSLMQITKNRTPKRDGDLTNLGVPLQFGEPLLQNTCLLCHLSDIGVSVCK